MRWPRRVRVENVTRETLVAAKVAVADRWWSRARGLLGRPPLPRDEGLLLVPCRSVHMFGMRFPIDVAFVTGTGRVVGVYHALQPGGRSGWHREAGFAIELAPGTLAQSRTRIDDQLAWTANPPAQPAGAHLTEAAR